MAEGVEPAIAVAQVRLVQARILLLPGVQRGERLLEQVLIGRRVARPGQDFRGEPVELGRVGLGGGQGRVDILDEGLEVHQARRAVDGQRLVLIADLAGVAGGAVEAQPRLVRALLVVPAQLGKAEMVVALAVLIVDGEADREPVLRFGEGEEAVFRHVRRVQEALVAARLLERLGPGPGHQPRALCRLIPGEPLVLAPPLDGVDFLVGVVAATSPDPVAARQSEKKGSAEKE